MMTHLALLNPNKKERSEENSPLHPSQNLYWCLITLLGLTKHFFLTMKGIPWISIFIFCFFHLFNLNYHLMAASWFLLSSAFDYYLILYCSSSTKTQIFHNHLVLPSAAFPGKYMKTIGMRIGMQTIGGLFARLPPGACIASCHQMPVPQNLWMCGTPASSSTSKPCRARQ